MASQIFDIIGLVSNDKNILKSNKVINLKILPAKFCPWYPEGKTVYKSMQNCGNSIANKLEL